MFELSFTAKNSLNCFSSSKSNIISSPDSERLITFSVLRGLLVYLTTRSSGTKFHSFSQRVSPPHTHTVHIFTALLFFTDAAVISLGSQVNIDPSLLSSSQHTHRNANVPGHKQLLLGGKGSWFLATLRRRMGVPAVCRRDEEWDHIEGVETSVGSFVLRKCESVLQNPFHLTDSSSSVVILFRLAFIPS